MQVAGKIVMVTGGAQGIGRALCVRLHAEGAAKIVVTDLKVDGAKEVAALVDGIAFRCDVTSAEDVARVIKEVESTIGPIDLYCSNAGILEADPDLSMAASAFEESWTRSWSVNVMGHVHAARTLLPSMIARKQGHFLITVSAAGLLTQIGSATYSTTKHAALGFSEYIAIMHRDDGIRVSVLCPQGVDTAMARGAGATNPALMDGLLSPETVAEAAVQGLASDQFLILPHPQVATYVGNKTADYGRWIGGMAKIRRAMKAAGL